ncbi:MAG: VOC family protein [Betaproteobacteria bacterium]|nr:VOC family protein [Betaproteobacteria bacterium]
MDVFKTQGAFSWSELMTTDPTAAVAFYTKLFGWGVQDMDMGTGPYHVVKVGETSVAGIMGMPPGAAAMPPAWGCYVTVDNVDQTLARCSELGGKTLVPPMDVPGVGRMAVLQDPQGAVLSVMTYSM